MKTLEQKIDGIPGEEGWIKGKPSSFYEMGSILKDLGYPDNLIIDLLCGAYWDVAGEYGA